MIKLSIIVPFYNVEPYIEQCICSLYSQDIPQEEYEVICVDDCSIDGSRAIVERLQKEYPTLKLLTHTENKRQGGARNTGMRKAKGEYIWFVDSDDYIRANCLKGFITEMDKESLDIIQFDYERISKGVIRLGNIETDVIQGEEYLFREQSENWIEKINGPWLQIFRGDFLKTNHIEFVENVQYEDTDYMLKVFIRANRVKYINKVGYYYRYNTESTTQSNNPVKTAWKVNQLARCVRLISQTRLVETKNAIRELLRNTLSATRVEIKKFNRQNKVVYLSNIDKKGVDSCNAYMNWRTRATIRYAITIFV